MTESGVGVSGARLSHTDAAGRPVMVDVAEKDVTRRTAAAVGELHLRPDVLELVVAGELPKGPAIDVARVAGIQAAKRTAELVPMCHPLPMSHVAVDVLPDRGRSALVVEASVRGEARTGFEMEALTAVSVALLTLYDMIKSADRGMRMDGIRLLEKSGGASGDFKAVATSDQDSEGAP